MEDDIETIESGYEFLLAYAAQGRPAGVESGPGPHARPTIDGMTAAMKNIAAAFLVLTHIELSPVRSCFKDCLRK